MYNSSGVNSFDMNYYRRILMLEKKRLQSFRSIPLIYEKSFSKTIGKYHLTQNEVDVLGFLHVHPEYNTAKKICELRKLPKSNVSVAIDRLMQKGYLLGERDVKDRRIIHLTITNSAAEVVGSIMKDYEEFMDVLLDGFSKEEKELWSKLERKMSMNIEKALGNKEDSNGATE